MPPEEVNFQSSFSNISKSLSATSTPSEDIHSASKPITKTEIKQFTQYAAQLRERKLYTEALRLLRLIFQHAPTDPRALSCFSALLGTIGEWDMADKILLISELNPHYAARTMNDNFGKLEQICMRAS